MPFRLASAIRYTFNMPRKFVPARRQHRLLPILLGLLAIISLLLSACSQHPSPDQILSLKNTEEGARLAEEEVKDLEAQVKGLEAENKILEKSLQEIEMENANLRLKTNEVTP